MNFKNDFSKSLEIGKTGEEIVSNYFLNRGYKITFNKSTDYQTLKKYDLLLKTPGQLASTKVEVKTDFLLGRTPNFALEFECSGKASGIATTEASLIVYYSPVLKELWLFNTKDLQELINTQQYSRIAKGGDNYNAKLYLFPYNKMRAEAVLIELKQVKIS